MIKRCTDCKKFMEIPGCQKNADEWARIKEMYPVSKEDARLDHHPQTLNERLRVRDIDHVAQHCKEGVFA